jgi:2-methylcitrate dehydratase PrpD
LKPYCCCAGQHTVLDAVARLQDRVPAITAESVARIEVRQNAREVSVVGRIRAPGDVVSAQFSAAFGIAMRLTGRGNGFHDYMTAPLGDVRVRRVIECVDYAVTEEPLAGDGPAAVIIELRDGSRHREVVEYARGSVQDPMALDEVLAKFHDLADDVLGTGLAARVVETVMHLEDVDDLASLTRLLVARDGYQPPAAVAAL